MPLGRSPQPFSERAVNTRCISCTFGSLTKSLHSLQTPLLLCKCMHGVLLPRLSSLCLDHLAKTGSFISFNQLTSGRVGVEVEGYLFTSATIKTQAGLAQQFYSSFYLPPVSFRRYPPFLLLHLVILPVPRLRRG